MVSVSLFCCVWWSVLLSVELNAYSIFAVVVGVFSKRSKQELDALLSKVSKQKLDALLDPFAVLPDTTTMEV